MIIRRRNTQWLLLLSMFSITSLLFGQEANFKFRKSQRIIKKMIRKRKVPGLAITIAKKDQILFSKGFGYADVKNKVKVLPDSTIFRIGSVSKPIAAVGLAQMVEDSTISLNESLYTYLPKFPKKKHDFTIAQLGGHLAGIRNYKGNEFMNNEPLSIAEGVQLFESDSLLFEPGKDYAYTSYSWNLLSLAMQEIAQVPFEELIQKNVLDKAKMKHTYADQQQDILHKAKFYRKPWLRRFKEVSEVHNYFKLAGGGYLSTSEDIAKFGMALLKGELVGLETLKKFTSSQYIGENKTYYGIGFQASYDHAGRPYYGHVGNGLGGYGIFYVYPESDLVISILMNCSNPEQESNFNALLDAIFESI